MLDPKTLDEMARRVTESLPSGLTALQKDLEKNIRAVLQSALQRMDLVTREEFEVQQEVLARTREKLEALSERVARLEAAIQPQATEPPQSSEESGE